MGLSSTETETKLFVSADEKEDLFSSIPEKILELGGGENYNRLENNIIFDTPTLKLKKDKKVLRLRQIFYLEEDQDIVDFNGPVELTYKEKAVRKNKVSSRTELNVGINYEEDNIIPILYGLGFNPNFRYEKIRRSYKIENCLVELDTLPHIGSFIEIEGPNESKINKIIKTLGLENLAHSEKSYIRLLKDYMEKYCEKSREAKFRNTKCMFRGDKYECIVTIG